MKYSVYIVCAAILMLTAPELLTAQEINTTKAKYGVLFGLIFQQRGSVNTADIPEGSKTGLAFSDFMDVGAQILLPFSSENTVTGFRLDIGWATYNNGKKGASGAGALSVDNYGYYNISPSIVLGGFCLGVDYGVPASIANNGVATVEGLDDRLKKLNPLLAIRAGGAIPILTMPQGRLNFELHASYCFNRINDVEPPSSGKNFNPQLANLSFGVSYLINTNALF